MPRMGVIQQSVRLDCLSDEFLNDETWGETVASMTEFDGCAAERFTYLQEIARRLRASPGRSDG